MVQGGGRLEAASRLTKGQYQKLLGGGDSSKDAKTPDLGSYTEWEAKDGYQRATAQHKGGVYDDAIARKG